jgi:two-component system CheB/CheR fusion protein
MSSPAGAEHPPGPRLVLDQRGHLAFVSPAAVRSLGVDGTDVGRPFQDLAICHEPIELHRSVLQASTDATAVEFRDVAAERDGGQVWYDVQILPLTAGNRVMGVEISFRDVTRHHERAAALDEVYGELEAAYRRLQHTQEEVVRANGQLQSALGEVETTSAELRDANAELEAMNDDLRLTNQALQALADGLRQRTGFLDSLLTGLPGGLVVVDRDLVVRVWSDRAESRWGLRRADAHGRPLADLGLGVDVDAVRRVLHGDMARTADREGRQVDCQPLLAGGGVAGVVLVHADVTP